MDYTDVIVTDPRTAADLLETKVDCFARRRMAALRICRFLRDTTCDPTYAACRRRLVVAVAVAEAEEDMGL